MLWVAFKWNYELVPPFLLSNIIPVPIAFPTVLFKSQNGNSPTPESRRARVIKSLFFIVKNGFWEHEVAKMAVTRHRHRKPELF